MITRRAALAGACALAGSALAGVTHSGRSQQIELPPPASPSGSATVNADLIAAERLGRIIGGPDRELPLWTFTEGPQWPPVIRMRLGDRFVARVENRLKRPGEFVTIHWHGLRIPNGQDGVPYVTQPPIEPGSSFTYDFVPPDTGTYFFHTHCNTIEQLGRGLAGILVVEGDEVEPYDADLVLGLKDWRVDLTTGTFLPFTSDDAARAGTFGTLRTVNRAASPTLEAPAGADVRLRILNIDPARISQIGIKGAEAYVIAIDGVAVEPFALDAWRLGSAMRIDVAVRTPADGGAVRLVDYFAPKPIVLATIAAKGASRRSGRFVPHPLSRGRMPMADTDAATRLDFVFSATATGAAMAPISATDESGLPLGGLCLAYRSFWAINKKPWPDGGHKNLPPPLTVLKKGEPYVFRLVNTTPHSHPIHLHGHMFRVLSSSKRQYPPHWADTVLLAPRERVEIAFVADNPGDWMFHCHIIEHQETGMMGFLRVA